MVPAWAPRGAAHLLHHSERLIRLVSSAAPTSFQPRWSSLYKQRHRPVRSATSHDRDRPDGDGLQPNSALQPNTCTRSMSLRRPVITTFGRQQIRRLLQQGGAHFVTVSGRTRALPLVSRSSAHTASLRADQYRSRRGDERTTSDPLRFPTGPSRSSTAGTNSPHFTPGGGRRRPPHLRAHHSRYPASVLPLPRVGRCFKGRRHTVHHLYSSFRRARPDTAA